MGLNTTGLSLSQMFGNKNSQFYIKGSYLDLTPYGLLIKDSYDWRRRYNQQCLDLLYSTQGKSWEVKMQGLLQWLEQSILLVQLTERRGARIK